MGLMYAFVIFLVVFVFYWLKKNSVNLQICEYKEGIYMSTSIRGRFVRNKFYSIRDLFRLHSFPLNKEDLGDYFLATESAPIIGVKTTIELKKIEDKYVPWKHSKNIRKSGIDSNKVAWTESTRNELYESTKPEISKAEQFSKIILPIGLIILAIACLIFFPKIYNTIMEQSTKVAETAISRFTETMNRFIPIG